MKLAHAPEFHRPAVCHYCGEAIPVVAWYGFDRFPEDVLALCRECAWSVAGGLLLDLADSDAAFELLLDRLRARRIACEANRARTRASLANLASPGDG